MNLDGIRGFHMKLTLALDTALGACSAAVLDQASGEVLASAYEEMERGHAERLSPMVLEVLGAANVTPQDLHRIVVTNGPGTFTGLRIALSLARGMGLALGIPVSGINTLEATAAPHLGDPGKLVVAHLSGGTGRYFAAALDRQSGKMSAPMALLEPEDVAVLVHQQGDKALLLGSGLAPIQALVPSATCSSSGNLPDAAKFVSLALRQPLSDRMPEPVYLREPDAKPSVPAHMVEPVVRAATAADIEDLVAIHARSFDKAWTADSLVSTLAVPGAGALVVELSGTIYGFLQFQWVAGEAEINTFCITPSLRRQNLGSALLEGLLGELRLRKTARVFLEVADNNVAARCLYERHGFKVTGMRKGYYLRQDGSQEDALMMAVSLDTPEQ